METSLSGKTPSGDKMASDHLAAALFAWGDFRDLEARLGPVKGVWRTSAGYAGENPSNKAGGYCDAVLIEYFPQTLSYGQLLELFMNWCVSRPDAGKAGEDKEPVIFYQTVREKRLAQATVERNALLFGVSRVRVLPFKAFYRKKEAV